MIGIVRPDSLTAGRAQGSPGIELAVAEPASGELTAFMETLGDRAVDLLVNNAGSGRKGTELQQSEAGELSSAFSTNVLGAFAMAQACESSLLKSDRALIVNISSRHLKIRGRTARIARSRLSSTCE